MDVLILEKVLNTAKTLAMMAALLNALIVSIVAYKFITKQSFEVKL